MDNDPFKEYASKMRKVKASDRLLETVLDQAHEERKRHGSAGAPATRKPQARLHRRNRTPLPRLERSFVRKVGIAACAVLMATSVSLASGLTGLPNLLGANSPADGPANTFSLVAFAEENPTGQTEQPTTLTKDNLDGGYSGAYYNPETQQFWNYQEWAGYKYRFNMTCTGQNIESVTYGIEGEHAYFEDIDTDRPADEASTPDDPVFRYSKSITLDYDNQHPDPTERILGIYLGFPVPDKARDIFQRSAAGDLNRHQFYDYSTAIDIAAGYALTDCHFVLTATFTDGSTQTKRYAIKPVPDFEQICTGFWEESYQFAEATEQNGSEPDPAIKPPAKPKMFTVAELS